MKDSGNKTGRGASGVLRRWLAAVLAWSAVGAATAADIPAHWLDYARRAGTTLQQRLAEDSAPARGLHDWMAHAAEQPQRQDPVVVKLWIGSAGEIERSEFASLGDAAADAALETLLQTTRLAQPPADMRQPLVLGLSLGDAEEDTAAPDQADTP